MDAVCSRLADRLFGAPSGAHGKLLERCPFWKHQLEACFCQLLLRVRGDGAPRAFPADGRFKASADELEMAYAEAWLACRFIADRYSESQLARLYAELARGSSLDQASRSTLHLSGTELTAEWQAYLDRLARY